MFGVSVVIEVAANILRGFATNVITARAVNKLQDNIKSNKATSVVKEFSQRRSGVLWVMPIYGVVVLAAGAAMPVLFVIYDSSIPYAFVIFDLTVMTWPAVGIVPIAVLRTKLGAQMDRNKDSSTLNSDDWSNTNYQMGKSPTSTFHRRNKTYAREDERDETVVGFGSYQN